MLCAVFCFYFQTSQRGFTQLCCSAQRDPAKWHIKTSPRRCSSMSFAGSKTSSRSSCLICMEPPYTPSKPWQHSWLWSSPVSWITEGTEVNRASLGSSDTTGDAAKVIADHQLMTFQAAVKLPHCPPHQFA